MCHVMKRQSSSVIISKTWNLISKQTAEIAYIIIKLMGTYMSISVKRSHKADMVDVVIINTC